MSMINRMAALLSDAVPCGEERASTHESDA
jgi:hypothetical protein